MLRVITLTLLALATRVEAYNYTVSWVPPPGPVDEYRVAYGPCGGPSTSLLVEAPATEVAVPAPAAEYCWTVYARNIEGESDPSNTYLFHLGTDTDGDGHKDYVDNCTLVVNPIQADSDGDGFGNRCDGDLNNNGATNATDIALFRQQLGNSIPAPLYNVADINENGYVNAFDVFHLLRLLGNPPGPSGVN